MTQSMNDTKTGSEELRARYMQVVTEMVDCWAEGKPLNTDSGKANGYFRLTAWLLEYLMLNNSLPQGVHPMPEGRDRFDRTEPSFPVDFDSLTEGFVLPE